MKTLIIFVILMTGMNGLTNQSYSQDKGKELVESFVNDLNKTRKYDDLMKKYFPDMWRFIKKSKEEDFEGWKDIQLYSILDIKLKLANQNFIVVSKKERPDLFRDVLSDKDPSLQFALVVPENDILVSYFLVEESKLSAISTMKKGQKHIYLGCLPG